MPGALGLRPDRPELVSLEMSGNSVSVILNQGAINIWFGKSADRALVARILIIISRIDSTTEHEKEVVCKFEKISEYESNGYILTSYARRNDSYRAIFVVPFSNERALDMFIESILEDLDHGEVRFTLYWKGGRARMNMVSEELSKLGCFTVSNPTYKEVLTGDQMV